MLSAQSFDLLLQDISRTIKSIGKTEFNIIPTRKIIIDEKKYLPVGNYTITIEVADPHITELKPIIDQIQHKTIETFSIPALLPHPPYSQLDQ